MSIKQTSLFELAKSIKQKSLPELAEYITPFTFSDSLCDGGQLAFERIEELACARCTELMQTGYNEKFDDWLGVKIRAYYLKFLAVNKKLEYETQLESNSQSGFGCELSITEEENNKFKRVLDNLVYLIKSLA